MRSKNILLGVTGSIAAYKAVLLTRLLIKAGADVRVIMTPAATDFVQPLTFSTLSKNEVYFTYSDESGNWNNHVDLAMWADIFLIAPATANTIAKLANGICDNLLLATYLSAKCPVWYAPAMDLDMWQHAATRKNIQQLEEYGIRRIEVTSGELASGLEGPGRMEEPEMILKQIEEHFSSETDETFAGKKVLISAGPTRESLDPVRFISNYSSGKMGYALAKTLADKGAEVCIVKGPTELKFDDPRWKVIPVNSAEEMYDACNHEFPTADITIMAAAVADYTPLRENHKKLKKIDRDESGHLVLELKKTKDILKGLGTQKKEGQFLVGFALETHDEEKHAQDKLHKKNLDLIVLNSLNDPGAGFSHDTNKVTLIDKLGNVDKFELKVKSEVAEDIVMRIKKLIHA